MQRFAYVGASSLSVLYIFGRTRANPPEYGWLLIVFATLSIIAGYFSQRTQRTTAPSNTAKAATRFAALVSVGSEGSTES